MSDSTPPLRTLRGCMPREFNASPVETGSDDTSPAASLHLSEWVPLVRRMDAVDARLRDLGEPVLFSPVLRHVVLEAARFIPEAYLDQMLATQEARVFPSDVQDDKERVA